MANLKRVKIDGYGQVELNRCAFPRDGRVEAQCRLVDGTAENGMMLVIEKSQKKCIPVDKDHKDLLMGLCYSAEHTQSASKTSLKDFRNEENSYPRIGILDKGDLFTTNTVAYFDDDFTSEDLLRAASVKDLAVAIKNGVFVIHKKTTHTTDADLVDTGFSVVKWTTMPDGQRAVQLMVM